MLLKMTTETSVYLSQSHISSGCWETAKCVPRWGWRTDGKCDETAERAAPGRHLLAAHLAWGLVKVMAGARGNDLGQKPIIAPFSQAPPPCLPEPSKTAAWSVLYLGKGPGVTDLLDSNPDLMWVQQWVTSPFFTSPFPLGKTICHSFISSHTEGAWGGYISIFSRWKLSKPASPHLDHGGRCGDLEVWLSGPHVLFNLGEPPSL